MPTPNGSPTVSYKHYKQAMLLYLIANNLLAISKPHN